MDVDTAMSVAETLFAALEYCQRKVGGHVRSIAGYKSQIDELRVTITRIKAVLRDAEAKQELSEQEQLYIVDLKDAVYEADDLFDEFVTLAEQKKLNKGFKERLFSFFRKTGVAFNMARGIEKIRKRLDAIANDLKFSFNIDPKPIRNRRPETCSYVYEADIIGRESDLEKIVGILMDSNVQQNVSFLSIVGIGGLGKTALAQLVFNDARITASFPLRLWTCVSDEQSLDIEGVLGGILASATDRKKCEGFTMDGLQSELRGHLEGKRFLLILDDVWTENRDQWLRLTRFLMGGLSGSWIVVTTRSQETARIVGDGLVHDLQGLSKENSWCLFKRVAFGSQHSNPPEDFVKIGQEIVESCASVPLAIRVVGSLLYGQDIQKWHSVLKLGLTKLKGNKDGIMPVLKLSYYQLESPLKSCFGYCALFPKDYEIPKARLIRLWMAQGYIIPSDDHQSMEDVAEEYFLILLRRCFFQDVVKYDGAIVSCKIHDLMHDVAQEVTGKEICTLNTIGDVDNNVRHLVLARRDSTEFSFTKTKIRSFLLPEKWWFSPLKLDSFPVDALLDNWKYLRALDLSRLNIKSLPGSISKLLHLRYLDLSYNSLEVLPSSFSKLYNLQTLILLDCFNLKELPKDMSKLVKLRFLDIETCFGLTYMPRGMGKLTCLHTLSRYVVGEKSRSRDKWFDGLEDLKSLTNLKGDIIIKIPYLSGIPVEVVGRKGGCLINMKHLQSVDFIFGKEEVLGRVEYDEAVMEVMHPHSNLKNMCLKWYNGIKMAGWARDDNLATFLPNLVSIFIYSCPNLQNLGCLGNLRHLEVLYVNTLPKLEYIIGKSNKVVGSLSSSEEGFLFFPSLKRLALFYLPKLKGWVGDDDDDDVHSNSSSSSSMAPLCLSQLKTLEINDCPEMINILVCPILESLSLSNFNKRGQIILTRMMNKELPEETSTRLNMLLYVDVDDVAWLNSQPKEAFQCLAQLHINSDHKVENLGEVGELFRSCSSSLRYLKLRNCSNLGSVNGGLEHLTALEELSIRKCRKLRLSEGEERERGEGIGMPWQSLYNSLRSLKLNSLPQLVDMPNWMQFLTALRSLQIYNCEGVEALPNWMPKLTSLNKLTLSNCKGIEALPDWMPKLISLNTLELYECSARLLERCQDSNGEDWHLIQHIPSVTYELRQTCGCRFNRISST